MSLGDFEFSPAKFSWKAER